MKNYVQDHLDTAPIPYGRVREHAFCKDGTKLSIQASEGHYCWPRNNFGPYSEVEVWCIVSPNGKTVRVPSMGDDHSNPYGYVPIEVVNKYIHRHGGLVEQENV